LPVAPNLVCFPNHVSDQPESQERKEEPPKQIVKVEDTIIGQILGIVVIAPNIAHGWLDGPSCHEEEQQDGSYPEKKPSPIHDRFDSLVVRWVTILQQERSRELDFLTIECKEMIDCDNDDVQFGKKTNAT
jgi:hypothetical protein